MTEWMVFFRRLEAVNLIFNLILATDLSCASEIGKEIADRHHYELVGIAPFARSDKGG